MLDVAHADPVNMQMSDPLPSPIAFTEIGLMSLVDTMARSTKPTF